MVVEEDEDTGTAGKGAGRFGVAPVSATSLACRRACLQGGAGLAASCAGTGGAGAVSIAVSIGGGAGAVPIGGAGPPGVVPIAGADAFAGTAGPPGHHHC